MSVRDALEKFSQRQIRKTNKKPRKNQKPEKQVVSSCMYWLNETGFSCYIIESKAVYSISANRYLRGQTISGMSDIIGCTPEGFGAFIEVKAKGRRSMLKDHQREFLRIKILKGAFGCVVDSSDLLANTYHNWIGLAPRSKERQIAYLLDQLPKKKKPFEDDSLNL